MAVFWVPPNSTVTVALASEVPLIVTPASFAALLTRLVPFTGAITGIAVLVATVLVIADWVVVALVVLLLPPSTPARPPPINGAPIKA